MDYDFLDLGCKTGGSIEWAMKQIGGWGLGVDIKPANCRATKKKGYDALCADVLDMTWPRKSVSYITMLDFLEHLPNKQAVEQVLVKCKNWANDFLIIQHPSFEYVDYLKRHSLKLAWTDWFGHKAPLTIRDFNEILEKVGISDYVVEETELIEDSSSPSIVPVSAPTDTIYYSKKLGKKPLIKFDKPVYGRVNIRVNL